MMIPGKSEMFAAGLNVRREVAGADYVDKSFAEAQADPFSLPLQELVTEYCWGAVWTRPGLSRKQRSMLNLAMLTALNRPTELDHHIRGALRNGCTREEICEVFLQAAVYCGVPAGMTSNRIAKQVFAEIDGEEQASR
jgi:4-carboxymuconolactone decarboxylase